MPTIILCKRANPVPGNQVISFILDEYKNIYVISQRARSGRFPTGLTPITGDGREMAETELVTI